MYNAGLGDVLRGAGNAFVKAGDFVFKEPAKSFARTLSTQNIQTALNPRSTATQRINAVGEDVLNVASIVPGVRAVRGATALKKPLGGVRLPKTMTAPPTYEYGIHTSRFPNITGTIDSSRFNNMGGGALDAVGGKSYQWRLSPQTGLFSNQDMVNRAVPSAQNWASTLGDRMMMDDSEMARITQYLTRGPASKAKADPNLNPVMNLGRLRNQASLYENLASEVDAPLEILGNVPYNPNQEEYAQALREMANRYARQIADNNVRLMYERGLLPKGYNLPPRP
jgi:hypothetical protein